MNLDDFISQQAAPQPGSSLDAFIAGQGAAPAANVSPATLPNTRIDRLVQGLRDPFDAGAQMLLHALPDGVIDGVNRATQAVNDLPVLGPITRSLGMTPATPQQVDSGIKSQETAYQASRKAAGNTGIDGWRMTGNIVGTAPIAAALPAAGGIGSAAATGAGFGALTPVTDGGDFWAKKAEQAVLGAAGGAVARPIVSAVAGVVAPPVTVAAKTLMKSGVTPTIGQMAGGTVQRLEDKLTSVPFLGDLIKNAQQRSVQDMNVAAYNKALAPIGQTFSGKVGSEGIQQVEGTLSDAYNSVLPKMTLTADPQFQAAIAKLGGMAQNLPDPQARQFMSVLKNQIIGKLGPQGTMDGQTLKGVQGELARIAKGYAGDASFDNRELGTAIEELRNTVDQSLIRTNPGDLAKQLQAANAGWANFTRLRTAAASTGAGNNGGVFSAAQLNAAVRAGDKSVGKGAFAKGQALMQDFSSPAQEVLGAKYPDSGTVGRGLLTLLPTLAFGHGYAPGVTEPLAGLLGLASMPYTKSGQKIMAGLLANRPDWAPGAASMIRKTAPALGLLGATQAPALAQ